MIHNRYRSAAPSGENVVVDLDVDLLRRHGVDVVTYIRASDEISDLPIRDKLMLPARATYARGSMQELRDLITRYRPDVMHLHNPYPMISPAAVRVTQSMHVPVTVTAHNYRIVCMNGVFFRDGHVCHDCARNGTALPGVLHACYRGSRAQSAAMAVAITAHRRTWRRVNQFIAPSGFIRDFLTDAGIESSRITLRPNVVPDPGPAAAPGEGFLFAGRLSGEKGVTLLLDAWQRNPEGSTGTLTVIGDGPLRPEVEGLARRRSDLHYLGSKPREAVADALRRTATTVVPSTCDEVCPTIVLESLAHGRPVLGTARGGIPSLVGQDAGWIVDDEPGALARQFIRVARTDVASAAAAARARYLAEFAPDVGVRRLLDAYSASRKHFTETAMA